MAELQFRRAHAHEAAALSALALASKSHWGYSDTQIAAWRDELIVTPADISAYHAHVGMAGADTIGFFLLRPGSPNWALEHFWMAPQHTGRGLGRAMLLHAACIAAQEGAAGLSIDADPNAEAFYLHCGAARIGLIAAPIEGAPERTRPQLLLGCPAHSAR